MHFYQAQVFTRQNFHSSKLTEASQKIYLIIPILQIMDLKYVFYSESEGSTDSNPGKTIYICNNLV